MRKNIKECGKILLTDSTLEAIITTNDPTTSRTILYDDVRVPFGKVLCDNGESERGAFREQILQQHPAL